MISSSRAVGGRLCLAGVCVALGVVALAGCGSSSSSSSGQAGSTKSGSVNLAAAQKVVAPYTGRTSPFPVTQPLVKHPPAGTKYALLQCATPVCALFAQLFEGATKALGVQLSIVKAGPSVTAQQSAMSTIISEKPAGVILPGVSGDTTEAQIHQLDQMHIPVVSIGVVNAQHYGISFDTAANPADSVLGGKLMAAWLVLQKRAGTNAVFYATPELPFSSYEQQGFDQEIVALCPACQVRNVDVPAADIGNTAPSLVVSDLQAHPSTNSVAFASEEAATGLPAALKVANLHVTVTGYAPPPAVLEYIKEGQVSSALDTDLPVSVWETVDALARLSTHEPLVDAEKGGPPINEFLEQKDITFNPAMGWTGYPDFPQMFAKLWR
jgi:ABC-type sugar transport system substrate-binding protein